MSVARERQKVLQKEKKPETRFDAKKAVAMPWSEPTEMEYTVKDVSGFDSTDPTQYLFVI